MRTYFFIDIILGAMADDEQFAKYPFLKASSAYIREKGPSLEDVLKGREYERVRVSARERVGEALEKGELAKRATATAADRFIELLSYPVARIIVSAVNDSFLTKRYALAEAVRAHDLLALEKPEIVMKIALELGLDAGLTGSDRVKVNFADFLHYASAMRGAEWKLVNQELSGGFVTLQWQRFLRILQQAVQYKIEGELPLSLEKSMKDMFRDDVRTLKAKLDEHKKTYRADDVGRLSVINLPPCIRKLLAMAQGGENVPHQGRFALTTFMHALGMGPDDIMKLFSVSPDFDPKKSRYQVEHITGVISSTEYSPPECRTMKTYNLCFQPDDLCQREWMTHPLKYYRAKNSRRAKSGKDDEKTTAGEKPDEKSDEKTNEKPGEKKE